MLHMTCPHCDRRIELPEERRGRPARCPECGGPFRAPLYDNEPATGVSRPGGGAADALVLAATIVAVAGLLATAAAVMVKRAGGRLPVPASALGGLVALPLAVIAASWFASRNTEKAALVWVSRAAAYLWLLGLLALLLNLV